MHLRIPESGAHPTPLAPHPRRVGSVDLLRGLIMVLMALDHARDYFGYTPFDPADLAKTTSPLFLSRWITHVCAPAFVFLAGVSAALAASTGKPRAALARTLLTRGVWLIILEFTIVRAAWFLGFAADITYRFAFVQVIWVIGWSMIILAALVHLPRWLMFALSCAMIAGHNALDHVTPESVGRFAAIWKFLHVSAPIHWGADPATGTPHVLFVRYPLVPWPAVMAIGYLAAPLIQRNSRRTLLAIGAGLTAAFLLLRAINLYGDPHPWRQHNSPLFSLFSFLNTEKYPPSLLYLLMTLGPAIAAIPFLHQLPTLARRVLTVYGQAPLFFYIAHLFVLQLGMISVSLLIHGVAIFEWQQPPNFGLPAVYLAWISAVALLYRPCRAVARWKSQRRRWWRHYV